MRIVIAVLALLMAAPARPQLPPPRVLSSWVQLTGGGVPEVRAVVEGGRCPAAEIDGERRLMSIRARPGIAFPNGVCALKAPKGARSVRLAGKALPLPARIDRILIVGDTGCRLKGADVQDCNNSDAWPFARLMRAAAAEKPDLVIHVGDYYYRETPCPAMYSGCAGSPHGDAWPSWKAEFFDPARPLLDAAPWVFARGNHESCDRGWRGWFRLLDAGPRGATPACPGESAPFDVPIGGATLHVIDSAGADDRAAPPYAVGVIRRQLAGIEGDPKNTDWIVTHRPFWDRAIVDLGPIALSGGLNRTQQAAVRGLDLSSVGLVLSGHVHHFAATDFAGRRPAQLVVGTGGDAGERGEPRAVETRTLRLDGMEARTLSFRQFGYLVLDRAGAGWTGAFRNVDGRTVARCTLEGRRLACHPV